MSLALVVLSEQEGCRSDLYPTFSIYESISPLIPSSVSKLERRDTVCFTPRSTKETRSVGGLQRGCSLGTGLNLNTKGTGSNDLSDLV